MKRRKTRQEKIIANLRSKLATQNSQTQTYAVTRQPQKPSIQEQKTTYTFTTAQTHPVKAVAYHYVIGDLKRTTLLTTGIIFAQILLYFILTNRIITLPFASF